MQKDYPERKNIRLQKYDYNSNGAYFITICIKNGQMLLGTIEICPPVSNYVGTNCVRPLLSEIGTVIEKELIILSNAYESVSVEKYVIMPNHIHMIIMITNGGRTQFVPTISRIIKQFKGSITKKLGTSIWQPRFYDRIIRSKEEYLRIWQYIDENPARWTEDEYFV